MRSRSLLVVYAVYLLAILVLLFNSCTRNDGKLLFCDVKYSTDIKPMIEARCAYPGCHVAGSLLPDLTQYDVLKVRADNRRLRTNVFELKIMPPATIDSLTAAEKEKLKCWLDNGAMQN